MKIQILEHEEDAKKIEKIAGQASRSFATKSRPGDLGSWDGRQFSYRKQRLRSLGFSVRFLYIYTILIYLSIYIYEYILICVYIIYIYTHFFDMGNRMEIFR